ncbi:MAG: type II secretion system protein M [Gammaproteobacteria bacterium]|nr:type II secretion system protein M [Gammaproteobacteria bacterium]
MRAFWLRLQLREQILLGSGGGVVLLLILYLQFWEPMQRERSDLEDRLQRARQEVSWMQIAASEVQQLHRAAPGEAEGGDGSLLSLIDRTARQQGLAEAIKRIQPEGEGVQIWFEDAPYRLLAQWLEGLSRQQVEIEAAVIDKSERAGRVKARLVVRR